MVPSTTWTRLCGAWRRPRCRCPTPSRWRRRPSRTTSTSPELFTRPSTQCGSRARERLPMPDITMPRLSDTMQEGKIARWLKQPGEPVRRGEVLAEIETDKATMELEAYDAGVLERVLVQEGQTVPIGQAI